MGDKRITPEQRAAIKRSRKISRQITGTEGAKIRTAVRQNRESFSYNR